MRNTVGSVGESLRGDVRRCAALSEILKAVAHPMRMRIVAILCQGPENVGDLAQKMGCRQAAVSQQLRILRTHKLVAAERRDGFARYSLAEPRLRDLIRCMEGCPSGGSIVR